MQKMMSVKTKSLDGISFDGADFWVSDIAERAIKKVSIHEQSILREIKFMPGGVPRALTYTNDSLLVLNYDPREKIASDLIQINVMNGKTLRVLHCPNEIDSGITFANNYFWGTSSNHNHLVCFHPATGDILKIIPFAEPLTGLCFDGENLVIVKNKEEGSIISIFDPIKEEIIKESAIEAKITGITFAENMLFYTNHSLLEIQVTRIKLD